MQSYNKNLFTDIFDNILVDLGECIKDPDSELCGCTAFENCQIGYIPPGAPPPRETGSKINFIAIISIFGLAAIAVVGILIYSK